MRKEKKNGIRPRFLKYHIRKWLSNLLAFSALKAEFKHSSYFISNRSQETEISMVFSKTPNLTTRCVEPDDPISACFYSMFDIFLNLCKVTHRNTSIKNKYSVINKWQNCLSIYNFTTKDANLIITFVLIPLHFPSYTP